MTSIDDRALAQALEPTADPDPSLPAAALRRAEGDVASLRRGLRLLAEGLRLPPPQARRPPRWPLAVAAVAAASVVLAGAFTLTHDDARPQSVRAGQGEGQAIEVGTVKVEPGFLPNGFRFERRVFAYGGNADYRTVSVVQRIYYRRLRPDGDPQASLVVRALRWDAPLDVEGVAATVPGAQVVGVRGHQALVLPAPGDGTFVANESGDLLSHLYWIEADRLLVSIESGGSAQTRLDPDVVLDVANGLRFTGEHDGLGFELDAVPAGFTPCEVCKTTPDVIGVGGLPPTALTGTLVFVDRDRIVTPQQPTVPSPAPRDEPATIAISATEGRVDATLALPASAEHRQVRGHDARYLTQTRVGVGNEILTDAVQWVERPGVTLQVASRGLSSAELLAIAEDLHVA